VDQAVAAHVAPSSATASVRRHQAEHQCWCWNPLLLRRSHGCGFYGGSCTTSPADQWCVCRAQGISSGELRAPTSRHASRSRRRVPQPGTASTRGTA